jgi:hypothetical protein
MLNELYQLSISLDRAGIEGKDWHKELKALPQKNLCYRFLIGENAEITGVEIIRDVSHLRKWEKSNGNSFPGLNLLPLFVLEKNKCDEKLYGSFRRWKDGKDSIDIGVLIKCCEAGTRLWDDKLKGKLEKCIGMIPAQLREICGDIPDEFSALHKLFERVALLSSDGVDKLFDRLFEYLIDQAENKESFREFLPLLLSEKSENISVYFDVSDFDEFPVMHPKIINYINECLLRISDSFSVQDVAKKNDAYNQGTAIDDKLPEVKLPVLGAVKLRAMNKESPCQYRYNTIDGNSFPIGEETRKKTKRALEWLGNPSREGKTWGRIDGKELLFAYPTIIPEVPPCFTAMFGTREDIEGIDARFESYSSSVVGCLKGIKPSRGSLELRVFSLQKMDKARTKVVFHQNYSAERIKEAVQDWLNGFGNIPEIQVFASNTSSAKKILLTPTAPFPLQIAECLNSVWQANGESNKTVPVIPKTAGIELLLDETYGQRQIPYLLSTAVKNCKNLMLWMGNNLHQRQGFKADRRTRLSLLVPSIVGIFLWKQGIKKEIYMENVPYHVGRILKIADELHALYCKEVRRNDSMPPQLLGNGLMISALNNPTQALAQLSLRLTPYLAWARTNSTESAGLSRYLLKELGDIEMSIRDKVFPQRLSDSEKSQLLLGYISSNQRKTID